MSWESFFHRVGEAAKNAAMATPLGTIWEGAGALVDPIGGKSRLGSLEDVMRQRGLASGPLGQVDAIMNAATAKNPDDPHGGFGVMDAAHFPYDYLLNRPLGTARGVMNAMQFDHASPLSASLWRKNWNLSDHVSVGQFIGASSYQYQHKFGNISPNSPAAQDWFQNDPFGKISSGGLDFVANLFDPAFFAGKGIKAARLANTTFKDATARDLALDLSRGNITADEAAKQYGAKIAKRAVKQQTRMDQFLTSTRGMNKTQLMQMPQFRDTSDAGAIAYWIERADKAAVDDADALSRKRDIFGVVLGNQQSIDNLMRHQADLVDEMQRMSRPVETTNAQASFMWGDYGKSMYDMLNGTLPKAAADRAGQVDKIEQELARLDRLYSIRASTSKFAANRLERAQTAARMRDLQESVSYNGMASRPVRVVRGTVGKAAPGHINAVLTDEGLDELRRVLGRSSMSAQTRAKLLDDYAAAPTRGARVRAVQEAERQIFHAEGQRFGKSTAEINKLLELAAGRRASLRYVLRSRLYSAAPEAKYVRMVDEDGIEHAFDRPFLQSQLDDMVPITDPQDLQKVLKQEARTGWLGAMTRGGSEATDALEQLAQVGTRIWKDAQLFRLAYPMRVQVDTQMRLMASLGALQYVASAGRGFVNLLSNHDFIANDIERLTSGGSKVARDRASQLTRPESFGTYRDQATIDRLTPQVEELNARITAARTPHLETHDYEGVAGNPRHITRTQRGTVPTRAIAKMDGASGERPGKHARRQGQDWQDFVDDVRANGVQKPIFITVDDKGPRISEGNHRRDAAVEAGLARVPVEIRYFGHAERDTPVVRDRVNKKVRDLIAKRDELQARLDRAQATPIDIRPARSAEELDRLQRTLEGHTYRDMVAADVHDNVLRQMRATGDFDIVQGGDPNWAESMLRAVNKQIRNSPTAMQVMREGDDHAVAKWLLTDAAGRAEWRNFSSEYDNDPLPWIGMIRAHINHTIPDPELQARVLERPMSVDDMTRFYDDVTARPAVHGEVYVPFIKSPIAVHWENARNWWYNFASDTPETIMGRHPLYNARFRQHMREIIARHDGETITADDVAAARRVADRKARKDVADTLFDLSNMSNLAHLTRFISPFFAAWEDTMTKWGRLLYDDPSRAIRLEQVWTAPNKADVTLVDDQGQEFIILPGIFSPFGSKGWRIRKDSFNIVFQGEPWWLPGFGPLVQVPINQLVLKFFPQHSDDKALKYLLPTGVNDNGVRSQLEPAWWRKAEAAFRKSSDDYHQTYAMLMEQELVKYNLGKRKTKPTRAEIAHATRNWHLMRMLTSFAAPVSADPTPEFQYYIDKAHEYLDQNQQIEATFKAWEHSGPDGKAPRGEQPPPRDWQEKFYRDHPEYFEMSVSLSKNNTGIVASDKAFQAIQKHRKLIAEHPDLGWFIVGPDNNGDFSQGVYAFEKSQSVGGGSAMTFRGSKDPVDAVRDAEAAKGWMDYRKGMTMIQLELEARGLHSLQQHGAEDLLAAKQEFISNMSETNPAWAQAFGQRDDNKAESFLRSAQEIVKGDLAKRPDMVVLQQYLEGRRALRAELKRRGLGGLPNEDSVNSPNRDLRIAWDEFTSSLIASNVGFEQMWQRALEADTLRNDI